MSEALIFEPTNPQNDDMFSPCSPKRRAPDKDLPVLIMAQPSEKIKKTQVILVPFFLGHTLVYWKPNSDIYAKRRKKGVQA